MFHRFHPGLKISNTVLQFLKIGDLEQDVQITADEDPVNGFNSPGDSSAK